MKFGASATTLSRVTRPLLNGRIDVIKKTIKPLSQQPVTQSVTLGVLKITINLNAEIS